MYTDIGFDDLKIDSPALLVVVATEVEIKALLAVVRPIPDEDNVLRIQSNSSTYYLGLLGKYLVVVVRCNGMGSQSRDGSLNTVSEAIRVWQPKAVLMPGICFGRDSEKQKIGDVLIADMLVMYEVARVGEEVIDRGPKPQPHSVLLDRFMSSDAVSACLDDKRFRVVRGPLLSGEKLVDDSIFKQKLFLRFPETIGGEMEGAGLYSACSRNNIPWILIKSICDWGEGKSDDGQELASKNCMYFIRAVLEKDNLFGELGLPSFEASSAGVEDIVYKSRINDIMRFLHVSAKVSLDPPVHDRVENIHYEYGCVEYRRSMILGFLYLYPNTSFAKSVRQFLEGLAKMPNSIDVLTPKVISRATGKLKDRRRFVEGLFSDLNAKGVEVVFRYIEDYLFENSLRSIRDRFVTPVALDMSFIDQELFEYESGASVTAPMSLDHFDLILRDEGQSSQIHIVIGKGGVGKSTFCDQLVGNIHKYKNKLPIYISSTDFKGAKHAGSIESVTDLYKAYTAVHDMDSADIMGPDKFEVNLSCGNIIIVIDGLDEIESRFGENFNLDDFLLSIKEINDCYRRCVVVVTARDYHSERYRSQSFAKIYRLLGFNDECVARYLDRRLAGNARLISKVYGLISELKIKNDGRLFPLYLDIMCRIFELDEKDAKISLGFVSKYFSQGCPVDSLLMELLEREIAKHSLQISIDDFFDFLVEICVHSSGVMSLDEAAMFILEIEKFDSSRHDKEKLLAKYYVNSLLKIDNEKLTVSVCYDFIEDLVRARYLYYHLVHDNFNLGVHGVLSEMHDGTSQVIGLCASAFKSAKVNGDAVFSSQMRRLQRNLSSREYSQREVRRAISGLLYLFCCYKEPQDIESRTESIVTLFGDSEIDGFSVYGHFYPLDFTKMKIKNGYFSDYANISKSRFPDEGTVFSSCEFNRFEIESLPILDGSIFSRCTLDDCLQRLIADSLSSAEELFTKIKHDFSRLCKVGFRSGGFVWKSVSIYRQKAAHLKYFKSLESALDLMVSHGIMGKERAEIGTQEGYRVTSDWTLDAKKLVENSVITTKMRSVIKKLI